MKPFLSAEIEKLRRDIERVKKQRYDPLKNLKRVPTPLEFAEAVLGGPVDVWQKSYLVNALGKSRIGIAASRQSGKSTVTAIFVAWCLLFIPGFQCLVASRSLRQASHYLSIVRNAVLTLIPRDSMPQLNRLSMELPHGSQVISIPCAQPDAGRGFSPHLAVLDEAAFAPEDLFRAVTPSLAATHGALHMLSSPNGRQGYFFEAFEGNAREVFWSLRVKWTDCPRISREMMKLERIALGDLYFRQEYEAEFITPLGAFFGASALAALEEGEHAPIEDIDLADLEALLDNTMPAPEPTVDDLKAALDRTDRVRQLLYG